MGSKLQLIASNWNLVYSTAKVAVSVPHSVRSYFPIPEFSNSVILHNPILAISAVGPADQPTWKMAGKIKQVIRTGLEVGGQTDTVNSVKQFYLNQISKIEFPNTANDFTLLFEIPYWIRNISLEVWEYTGPIIKEYDSILEEIKEAVLL
jgi:hypothetical protein